MQGLGQSEANISWQRGGEGGSRQGEGPNPLNWDSGDVVLDSLAELYDSLSVLVGSLSELDDSLSVLVTHYQYLSHNQYLSTHYQ